MHDLWVQSKSKAKSRFAPAGSAEAEAEEEEENPMSRKPALLAASLTPC